jgi:hypothetical protein
VGIRINEDGPPGIALSAARRDPAPVGRASQRNISVMRPRWLRWMLVAFWLMWGIGVSVTLFNLWHK